MKGDFSKLEFRPNDNFTGVLHQQGRVFTDQDGNADNQITRYLREMLGQDTIGQDLVAVPAASAEGLQVVEADSNADRVLITLNGGRAWIDGLHLQLPDNNTHDLIAEYFGPPIEDPQPDTGSISAGVRDAVILEVWEEAFSAFQDPQQLLEPALGGPDTTERSRLQYALRLLRLAADDDCGNLADRLADDPATKGHLTVTADPVVLMGGDCPVQVGGGYSGFEHYLYRIEVGLPLAGAAQIKYSRFNGGLVGRGEYDSAGQLITITANNQMINYCGLDDYFLEVMVHDADLGHWRTVLTADATRTQPDLLSLNNIEVYQPAIANGDEVFFRLWDGRLPVTDFSTGAPDPVPLEAGLGIRLELDPPLANNSNYQSGDYWTFPVRAAGVDFDPSVWPSNAAPQGVNYHRAPLAILNWTSSQPDHLTGIPEIHDCRHVFKPLTKILSCCTYSVGDGLTSTGDFESIQEAINHLPSSGGEICVLPGVYRENVVIDKNHVRIHGCGRRSRVVSDVPVGGAIADPVFRIEGQHHIRIESLQIEAHDTGMGILALTDVQNVTSHHIRLKKLRMSAATDSAIKLLDVHRLKITDCRISMADEFSEWSAIFMRADDVLVEHNILRVQPRVAADGSESVVAGRGGLHIAGTSERVQVIDNNISGGISNGITLGSVEEVDASGTVIVATNGWVAGKDDLCDPCSPGGTYVPPATQPGDPIYRTEGALYDIRIERNRIEHMGMNGIGVVLFFDLESQDEFISVIGLDILGNQITQCLQRDLEPMPAEIRESAAYGGITLADVESLRVFDNVIEDNGPSQMHAICGIYILHGEGVYFDRNRIVNNGAKTGEDADDAIEGRRGGIVIEYAMPGVVVTEISSELRLRQDGVPAVRIHDNIISQPLGRALSIQALGSVSVQGNNLTSRGVIPSLTAPGFIASTVFIFNLGISNELYLQTLFFTGVSADPQDIEGLPPAEDDFISMPRVGLDDARFGQYMANGNVMFTNNQVMADLVEEQVSFALTSVLIFSLDDVVVTDNQIDCSFLLDLYLTNIFIVGMSIRITDNRIKESLIFALFSSIGMGLFFNHTVANQATHCILSVESPLSGGGFFNPEIREAGNMVLMDWFSDGFCGKRQGLKGMLAEVQ